MVEMTRWAIRHKSGEFVDTRTSSTHREYGLGLAGANIRLFKRKSDAKAWVTIYCRGPLIPVYRDSDEWGNLEPAGLAHKEQDCRDPNDFQVLEVTLNIEEPT